MRQKIRYKNVLPCLIFISIQVSRVTIRLEKWFYHLLWRRILQWKGPIFLSWCIKFRYEWLWEVNFLILPRSIRKNLFGVDFPYSQQCFSNRSMIITGCSPWTLYEFSNFQGQSACWYPADTSNCYPSFFRDENKMNGWAGQVSSVRHGCFSAKKRKCLVWWWWWFACLFVEVPAWENFQTKYALSCCWCPCWRQTLWTNNFLLFLGLRGCVKLSYLLGE